jgi:hypothetical protein
MALDFPRAFELARTMPADAHHPKCSFRQTDGAILCDCQVITDTAEYRCPAMHSAGGVVVRTEAPHYGPCPGHTPIPEGNRANG